MKFPLVLAVLGACANAGSDAHSDATTADATSSIVDAFACSQSHCDVLPQCGCTSAFACDVDTTDTEGTKCRNVTTPRTNERGGGNGECGCVVDPRDRRRVCAIHEPTREARREADRSDARKCRIQVWDLFRPWAAFVVGERKEMVIALDWTEFDADDHATLAGYLITNHGRATPLIWMTVSKATLKNRRNEHLGGHPKPASRGHLKTGQSE